MAELRAHRGPQASDDRQTAAIRQALAGAARRDAYAALGLRAGATPKEVRQAYRRMSLRVHPDKVAPQHRASRGEAATEAYKALDNAHERCKADAELRHGDGAEL